MDKSTTSGMILLEKDNDQYIVSRINGYFRDKIFRIRSDYFGDLQFLAECLDYIPSKIDRGGTLKTNNVSIRRTSTDKYDIERGPVSVTLREADMANLMKCLETSEGWDDDQPTLEYGLVEVVGPEVKTIREGRSFFGYVPRSIGGHFSLSVEKEDQVRIYHLTDSGDWIDVFKLDNIEEVDHVKRALLMVQDCTVWGQSISIASPCGSFDYDPEVASAVEISMGGSPQLVKEDEIPDIIRAIDLMED